jgi:hypothetical protein
MSCHGAAQVDQARDRNASRVQSLGSKINDQAPFARKKLPQCICW